MTIRSLAKKLAPTEEVLIGSYICNMFFNWETKTVAEIVNSDSKYYDESDIQDWFLAKDEKFVFIV